MRAWPRRKVKRRIITSDGESEGAPCILIPLPSHAGALGIDFVINIDDAEVVGKVFVLYEQGWSFLKIKKELEALHIPSPTGKRKWAVKTIDNILTNDKYTGNSVYGETVAAESLLAKRIRRISTEVHRSTNHHPTIIDEYRFDQVQKLRKKRSNMEVDSEGNSVRKGVHYSMKHPQKAVRRITKPIND